MALILKHKGVSYAIDENPLYFKIINTVCNDTVTDSN